MFRPLIVLAVLASSVSWACKAPKTPDHIPREVIDASVHIWLARVETAEQDGVASEGPLRRWRGTSRATVTVTRVLKGSATSGSRELETLRGEAGGGGCPLVLEPGETYLLFVTQREGRWAISRFDYWSRRADTVPGWVADLSRR